MICILNLGLTVVTRVLTTLGGYLFRCLILKQTYMSVNQMYLRTFISPGLSAGAFNARYTQMTCWRDLRKVEVFGCLRPPLYIGLAREACLYSICFDKIHVSKHFQAFTKPIACCFASAHVVSFRVNAHVVSFRVNSRAYFGLVSTSRSLAATHPSLSLRVKMLDSVTVFQDL